MMFYKIIREYKTKNIAYIGFVHNYSLEKYPTYSNYIFI